MGVSLRAEMKIMPFPLISFLTDLHCRIGSPETLLNFQVLVLKLYVLQPQEFMEMILLPSHSGLGSLKISVSPARDGRSQVSDLPPHPPTPEGFLFFFFFDTCQSSFPKHPLT